MDGNIFHLLNRGVEKRKIFYDATDYLRFAHNLSDFNDKNNADQSYYVRRKRPPSNSKVAPLYLKEEIVDVLSWCLMPNHPHILIAERKERTAGVFSRKVFGGYTMYFNEQNKRSGVLFQGKTKIIRVNRDAHFLYLPFYIHLNPLSIFQPNWKGIGVKDVDGAINFLEKYRWSNLRDILGNGDGEFMHITNRELFFELFDTNEKQYRKDFRLWLKSGEYKGNFEVFE